MTQANSYACRLKTLAAQPTATIRVRTTQAQFGPVLQGLLEEVWRYLSAQEDVRVGPGIARFHEFGEDAIDVEAGFPLEQPAPATARILSSSLPGGRAATTLHYGAYDRLPEAYAALQAWIDEHGHVIAGPPWEIYWVDPTQTRDPDEVRTEIVWPIHA